MLRIAAAVQTFFKLLPRLIWRSNTIENMRLCRALTREQAALERLRQDEELRQAYEESRITGDLLLKREGEELSRVKKYADQLMQKEYK